MYGILKYNSYVSYILYIVYMYVCARKIEISAHNSIIYNKKLFAKPG